MHDSLTVTKSSNGRGGFSHLILILTDNLSTKPALRHTTGVNQLI
ncbi:hypothetical protein MC7420_714 [Coleofasciculus chthonoplastes PCC 7420]|uniref:Uncharacterized protein n=1 Tax=Coleofasciculus chthonoplastes PCC 7420 TaxID=118168 RepID=B4VSX8_9CYAN|nr:hypothetical protein MC7420_714 [Coleofasciculus chthonoplastes PCC 7420]